MQNDDNSSMKPKRKRNRGKGKSGNKPTTHSFWLNIGKPTQPINGNSNVSPPLNSQNQPVTFQSPDQQLESVVDLIDDNAPNNPMVDGGTGSVKKPEKKQVDQKPKQQPVKWSNFQNIGNKQIKKQFSHSPVLESSCYQTEDFTEDPTDKDFTDFIRGPINTITSYDNQIVVKKQDETAKVHKPTEQNPDLSNQTASKPIILSNQLINSANKPVTSVNQPIASSSKAVTIENQAVHILNEPGSSVYYIKPVTTVNQSITSINKPVTSKNQPITSVNKPITLPKTPVFLVNNPISSNTTRKIPGKEVVRNLIVTSSAESPISTVTPVAYNKGNIQGLNKTYHTPIMEPTNEPSSMIPPSVSNIQQNRGKNLFNPIMRYSMPKGIPRSFLQPRLEPIDNSQQNPQMNTPISNTTPIWVPPQTQQYHQQYTPNPQPIAYNYAPYDASSSNTANPNAPMFVQTENCVDKPQQYSPSETYADPENNDVQEEREGSESPDLLNGSQKRLSAFKRLGPQAQPKKPKLTINLMFNKEQAVREVVDETEEKPDVYKPVHLREEIISSKDDIVVKYLPLWPWKRNVAVKKNVTVRQSKSVMLLELEQMQDEVYEKENMYVQITIKGYPPKWKKEQVLDVMLESVRGRSLIPIFIEFKESECKFLVIRCRPALNAIHKYGFVIRQDDVELIVTISHIDLTIKHIDFIPRLVLRKIMSMGYDGERKLNLKAFTLKNDISHFLYYPLHRLTNQMELVQLQSTVAWDYLTDLDLSHNKLTTLQGFGFQTRMPKLKHLNVSHNYFEKATVLLACRGIPLNSIWLEGNPLCNDYTDPTHYVRVLKILFPGISEIDGTPLHMADKLPSIKKNYCPEDAADIVNKFLEVFFPLLESGFEHRSTIQELYETDAIMTITYKFKLRYGRVYRYCRNLFLRCRVIDEGEMESVEGSSAISKLITKWPGLKHDPFTFTVDVMYHNENTTILRISGIVKLTAETLAEDEHLLAFTRTLVLHYRNGEYKIKNEMVYWDEPTDDYASTAFQVTAIKTKPLSLKLESTPDDDLKEKLINIFMQLTDMEKAPSVRCLEMKEWNLKNALEYFTKLLKLDSVESI